jgi:predicted RNA-binding protein associated with RNAse of E/G family
MINHDAIEKEEDHLCQLLNEGKITQKQFDDEMRELRYAVRAEYERDREDALRQVDDAWGGI